MPPMQNTSTQIQWSTFNRVMSKTNKTDHEMDTELVPIAHGSTLDNKHTYTLQFFALYLHVQGDLIGLWRKCVGGIDYRQCYPPALSAPLIGAITANSHEVQ